ncbi:MAG: TPM domain-containing protein [Bacteroidetes bacterium]|nr:TPM domain-containing protein [Bacteroidota bacterium]
MRKLKPAFFRSSLLLGFILLSSQVLAQFNIPPIPEKQTSLYDMAKVLTDAEAQALEQKLIRYADTTSTQIVVVTTASIKGENIGLLAPRWAQAWGIGQAETDNGVFILLAEKERQILISPGYGTEEFLTAGIVGEITRNIIIPEFKAGSYYRGLDKGSDAIFEVLTGQYQGSRPAGKKQTVPIGLVLIVLVAVFLIISFLSKKGGGNKGNHGNFGGPDLMDVIILSRMGRGGFGGSGGFGSSGGGGFGGGFGGGGFSGGGAGGSW